MVSQTSNSGHLFTSNCAKCLAALGLLLLLVSPVHSRVLHKRHHHQQQHHNSAEDSSFDGTTSTKPSDDSSGESKMPASWHALRRASNSGSHHHRHHNHQQQPQPIVDRQSHSAESETDVAEERSFTQEVILGAAVDADNSSGGADNVDDNGDEAVSRQQSGSAAVGGVQVSSSITNVDVLSEEGVKRTADSLRAIADKSREQAKVAAVAVAEQSKAVELDTLIREINEESKRERAANQADNSFQEAEAVKAKLDFEINRTRLILMRLRSLQRNVADAHYLAKKLVESDVVSKNIKDYALTNLDKSVETVKKVLVKM